ncbi:MAG TPA: aldo/keto reductase [Steroidobacteraceae bacterium]|jgi:diketogulonate reductase-like aldo/keto reductase|nr:aldo/keto reductase [Steroidobacteraceae bacterium]
MAGGIPNIIYGTAWKKERTEALVRLALAQGFRGIDTACQPKHYNEAGVGAAVAASVGPGLARGDLYLQTKFTPLSGQDPTRVPYDAQATLAEQVAQSFAVSQRNLQTSYVDALVLHSPLASREKTLEVWQAMEALVDSGGARRIGISNCYQLRELEALCRSARVQPAVVQNRFYAESGYDVEIRAFCREHNIVYQSFWTLSANPHILADETVRLLTLKYRRTPAQVLFRYLTLEGVAPLTGTQSEAHMREDLEIFDFELTPGERTAITVLLEENA